MDDFCDAFRVVTRLPEIIFCYSCPLLLVGDAGLLLNGTGNIVEEGGRDEDPHIRTLGLPYLLAEAGDAEDVVKIMGP